MRNPAESSSCLFLSKNSRTWKIEIIKFCFHTPGQTFLSEQQQNIKLSSSNSNETKDKNQLSFQSSERIRDFRKNSPEWVPSDALQEEKIGSWLLFSAALPQQLERFLQIRYSEPILG